MIYCNGALIIFAIDVVWQTVAALASISQTFLARKKLRRKQASKLGDKETLKKYKKASTNY